MTTRSLPLRSIATGLTLAAVLVACRAEVGAAEGEGTAASALMTFNFTGCTYSPQAQSFGRGMFGCGGSVKWDQRATLCAAGYHPATVNEWNAARQSIVPTQNYWTDDDLKWGGTGTGACSADLAGGAPCDSPMRVCTPSGTDAEGNKCNWTGCGLASMTNAYLGGCSTNTTAGTLCVPNVGCADGTAEQTFADGMYGCGGAVPYADRQTLCAPGYRVATAEEWVLHRKISDWPTADYWTNDSLDWAGSGPSSCSVGVSSTSANGFHGTSCGAYGPMHVCTATGSDGYGNTCTWTSCGLGANTPQAFFGGCSTPKTPGAAVTAGALCVPAVDRDTTCSEIPLIPVPADRWNGSASLLHLRRGWLVPRSAAGCPDVSTPQGVYKGRAGNDWLTDEKGILTAMPGAMSSVDTQIAFPDLATYVRSTLAPGITSEMLANTQSFCVYGSVDNGDSGEWASAQGDYFAAISSSGTALALCNLTLGPARTTAAMRVMDATTTAPPSVCMRDMGCPGCVEILVDASLVPIK
jgi:hypothetical protein